MINQVQHDELSYQDANKTRILIVDDDMDILHSLRDLLEIENENFLVMTASGSDQAKEIASTFVPQIVLLDIKLGNESGLDMVPYLKRNVPDIVCIMMTAYRDAEYAVSAVQFGADDYLYKPIDPGQFIKSIDNHVYKQIAMQEKRLSDLRFRAVFDQTYLMVLLLNDSGEIIEANNTALEFVGLSKEQIYGNQFQGVFWPNDSVAGESFQALFSVALSKNEVARGEWNVERRNKEIHMFEYSVKPVLPGAGLRNIVVIECHDITQKKEAESRLYETLDTLENRVIERTTELEIAKSVAESSSNAKTEFLSRMSHELRTPMNAILGFSQLLLLGEEPLSEIQKDNIDEVFSAAQHMQELIDEVLDMTLIESGNLNLDVVPVSINEILSSLEHSISSWSEEYNIEFINKTDHTECLVMADYFRLKQVLISLLSNAFKHSRESGTVTISMEIIEGDALRTSIIDTGEGLSEDKIDRMFIPFERMSADSVEGVGISMVVNQRLIEIMGGRLGVCSQPGVGSTFWVELGLSDVQADQGCLAEN